MGDKVKDFISKILSNCGKALSLIGDILKLVLKVSSEVVFKLFNNYVERLNAVLGKIDSNIEKRLGRKRYSIVILLLKIVKRLVALFYKFLYNSNIIFEEIVVEVDKATNNSYSKPECKLDDNSYSVNWDRIKNDNIDFGLSGGVYYQTNKDTYEFDMYFDEDNQPLVLNDNTDIPNDKLRRLGKMYFCNNIVNHIYNNKYSHKSSDQLGEYLEDNSEVKHKVYEHYRATFYEDNNQTACLVEEYKRKEWKFICLFELSDIKNQSDINYFNIEYNDNLDILDHKDNYNDIIDSIIKNNIKCNKVDILDILGNIFNKTISLCTTIFILYASFKSIKSISISNLFKSLVVQE